MKITADNRGRIALGKLDKLTHYKMGVADLAGSEWDVQLKDAQLIVKPWKEEPKSDWVVYWELHPWMIGKVVRVRRVWHLLEKRRQELEKVRDSEEEVVGELEAYSTVRGAEWLSLKGHTEAIWLTKEKNLGLGYDDGVINFLVQG